MNDNEYGKTTFSRTEDGKKELIISGKENIIDVLRENANDPDGERIDQIRLLDEENGAYPKKIIYPDFIQQKQKKKHTLSDKIFIFAVLAFIIGVAVFLLFFAS